jgi:hypothetical protein
MNGIPRFREGPPPAAPTTEGERINVEANAKSDYPQQIAGRKAKAFKAGTVVFRSETGQDFAHKGKVGRVLQMLATMPGGVTQYHTYPWHTRLGASIHLLRESGLAIETTREGEWRHGRYRLLTPGRLMIQAETGETVR